MISHVFFIQFLLFDRFDVPCLIGLVVGGAFVGVQSGGMGWHDGTMALV